MSDPLDDARLLVERANEQIVEFKALLKAFLDNEAWTPKIDFDVETGTYTHKLIIGGQPNRRTKAVAKDAWDNLRSALDHLNAACARLGGSEGHDNGAHFPFVRKGEDLASEMKRKCRNVPQVVLDYFASLRPYPGGDDRLYALSNIRNSNQHWRLRSAILTVIGVEVVWIRPGQKWEYKVIDVAAEPSTMHEIELFTSSNGTRDYHLQFMINVSFEDMEVFGSYDAGSVLDELSNKVTDIINHTETILRSEGLM